MSNDLHLIQNKYQKNQKIFNYEKKKLYKILNAFNILIEHIGSTSIKGTIGKGIIDIIITCGNEKDQHKIKEILNQSSFYRQGELNKKPDGRLFFCNSQGQTKAGDIHLHLVTKNSPNYHDVINFRNYLQNNPKEVEWYNNKKKYLANITDNNRSEYTRKKGQFIQELNERAKTLE